MPKQGSSTHSLKFEMFRTKNLLAQLFIMRGRKKGLSRLSPAKVTVKTELFEYLLTLSVYDNADTGRSQTQSKTM